MARDRWGTGDEKEAGGILAAAAREAREYVAWRKGSGHGKTISSTVGEERAGAGFGRQLCAGNYGKDTRDGERAGGWAGVGGLLRRGWRRLSSGPAAIY